MEYRVSIGEQLKNLGRESWNALTMQSRTPFYEWEWLALLEDSGSICPEEGWVPLHLCFRNKGRLSAVLPLYGKTHSHGEFVFDYGWADLARQLNVAYYPKLIGAVPATPSGFYSFFTEDTAAATAVQSFLADTLESIAVKSAINSVSFLFSDVAFGSGLKGFIPWHNQSFLWINRNYSDFTDYLSDLNKNQRRNVRREWQSLEEQGLEIRVLTGADLTEGVMEGMYRFYLRTNAQFGPWAARFLNRDFFLMLPRYVPDRTVIFAAVSKGSPAEAACAMSMCIFKGDWLFGRYWGASEEIKNLHFNLCYYAPIQWMIKRGMKYFDPGAGSPHKLKRGFMPHGVVSYHRFFNPVMEQIFRDNIASINVQNRQTVSGMEQEVPFTDSVKDDLRGKISQLFPLDQTGQLESRDSS